MENTPHQILDYAPPGSQYSAWASATRQITRYGFPLLTIIVAFICLRIESLNIAAGGRLPNREYRDNDPSEGPVEWRHSAITSEADWRRRNGPKDENLNPVDRPLTPAESARMSADIRREQANNSLLDFVGAAGLLQYILVPLLAVASMLVIYVKGVRYGIASLVVAVSAGALIFSRAYFTSLGW